MLSATVRLACPNVAMCFPPFCVQIGLVSQEPLLFSGTIADNILYGRPDATLAEV